MKKDFESRFMPNVKFSFVLPDGFKEDERQRCLSILEGFTVWDKGVYGFATNSYGDVIQTFSNGGDFREFDAKEVSFYEGIPELVPDGMVYAKDSDSLKSKEKFEKAQQQANETMSKLKELKPLYNGNIIYAFQDWIGSYLSKGGTLENTFESFKDEVVDAQVTKKDGYFCEDMTESDVTFSSRFMPNVKFSIVGFEKIVKAIISPYTLADGWKYFSVNDSGDDFSIIRTAQLFAICESEEVSIYEAIPELVPNGMKYNKELDKLVPDVMQWKKVDNGGNHIARDGTPFDTIEEAFNHNCTLMATSTDWAKENINPKIVASDDVEINKNEHCSGIKVEIEKVVDYTKENVSCKNEKSKHYEIWKDFEAIDVLKNCLTKDEFIGFLKGNILKYQLRLGKKDDVQKEMIKIKDYQNELNYILKELNVK